MLRALKDPVMSHWTGKAIVLLSIFITIKQESCDACMQDRYPAPQFETTILQSICRYLAELEMRLHLSAEDLDASLEDDSTRALRRVPNAVQEACSVKVIAQHSKGRHDISINSSAVQS